jgi:hypothetical protein
MSPLGRGLIDAELLADLAFELRACFLALFAAISSYTPCSQNNQAGIPHLGLAVIERNWLRL